MGATRYTPTTTNWLNIPQMDLRRNNQLLRVHTQVATVISHPRLVDRNAVRHVHLCRIEISTLPLQCVKTRRNRFRHLHYHHRRHDEDDHDSDRHYHSIIFEIKLLL